MNQPCKLVLDGANLGSTLAYDANTGYQSVHAGSRQFAIEAAGTTTNLVPNNATLSLGSGTETTVILAGFSSSLQGLLLTDDNTDPTVKHSKYSDRKCRAQPGSG